MFWVLGQNVWYFGTKMVEKEKKDGESRDLGRVDLAGEGSEMEKTKNENSEKWAIKEFGTKKEYKYPMFKLLLNEEREALLKECCLCTGLDKEPFTRIEAHQQDLIWDILKWVAPALRIRRYLMEVVGPVINCSPEREQNKELKQK